MSQAMPPHRAEPTNREGMTFEEFWHAATPAGDQHFGFIRTRTKLRPSELRHARDIYGTYVNLPDGRSVLDDRSANRTHVYGSKTRSPESVQIGRASCRERVCLVV